MKPSLYNNPQLVIESGQTPEGMITWQSPSNLALIKYWGKYGQQMPRNPSISLTLEQAYTHMTLEWGPKDGTDKSIELELFFQQMRHEGFEEELKLRMQKLLEMFPFLHQMSCSGLCRMTQNLSAKHPMQPDFCRVQHVARYMELLRSGEKLREWQIRLICMRYQWKARFTMCLNHFTMPF
jgi:hypothetical protein